MLTVAVAPSDTVGSLGVQPIRWSMTANETEPTRTEALLIATASGDEGAFAALYEEVSHLLFGVVAAVVRDPARSEEVTQEVFVDIWRHAPRFDPRRGKARSWMCTIAHRRAVDFVRREQALRDREARSAAVVEPTADTPEDVVTTAAEHEGVRSAFAQLSDLQHEALRLAYFEGRTYREVADHLETPLGTVKTRMRDGLARLGRLLEAGDG